MKKNLKLTTKRLVIELMTDEEIQNKISDTQDEELKKAYQEMLAGALRDPKQRQWSAPWKISLKKEGTEIGDLCFKGAPKEYAVEIGYGIDEAYHGQGYGTEAVSQMLQWAFGDDKVVFVEAETESDNEASRKLLTKCGFQPDGEGEEGPRYVLEKPLPQWMMIYWLFGMSIGMSIGMANDHMGIGMCLGICGGLLVGAALDANAKEERRKLKEERVTKKSASEKSEADSMDSTTDEEDAASQD